MTRLFFNFFYALICLSLLIICSLSMAASVYVVTDEKGHQHYSDRKPDKPYEIQNIEIENDYPWADAPAFTPSSKPAKNKRRVKKQKRYSLTELKTRCQSARGKYNSYRGSSGDVDWNTYRGKLERYKAKRDEWCSRLLKGK